MTRTTYTQLYPWAAAAIAFFSFFMAALVSRTVFERLPHLEDELAYIYQARIFANGDIVAETPSPAVEGQINYLRRAFWQPFVVDYTIENCRERVTPDCVEQSNRFGKYTPGWPLLLSIGIKTGQMWVINAFFGMLTVALVYRLGAEIFQPHVGLIAAVLTAFSPMALLLNATLMSHTSALFFFTLFMYSYWRIEQKTHTLRWGLIAGVGLGLLAAQRPSSALAVATPFVIWSSLKLLRALYSDLTDQTSQFKQFMPTLRPQIAIGVVALAFSLMIPFFNYQATNDASQNLYTLVWWYDRLGFGECCGASADRGEGGHNIVKGIRHTRFDMSLMAADLFGWQIQRNDTLIGWEPGEITPELQEHLQTSSNYWPLIGLSLFILPVGLLFGFNKWWMRAWLIGALYWLVYPLITDAEFFSGSPYTPDVNGVSLPTVEPIWRWLALGAGWWALPFIALISADKRDTKTEWTYLLLSVFICVVGIQLAYWVGSQRYTTRYYFEALTGLAIIAALAFTALIRGLGLLATLFDPQAREHFWDMVKARKIDPQVVEQTAPIYALVGRGIGIGVLAILLHWSLYNYSTPRINALHEFNNVRQSYIDAIEERRSDDQPVLVIVSGAAGTMRWRSFGSLMAITDPYQSNDIVGAWNYDANNPAIREQIIANFPDRTVIDMVGYEESAWFIDGICELSTGEDASISPDCNKDNDE